VNYVADPPSAERVVDEIRAAGGEAMAIRTPINASAWSTPEALSQLLTLIPYGRIGEPEDIGRADGGMTLFPGFSTNG
jgi:glucose 1-dehydrogenase